MGSLPYARAVVPAPQGEVVAEVRQSAERYEVAVTVPEGTEATVVVPLAGRAGARAVGADGRQGAGGPPETGETATFRLGPGRWRVVAE